MSAAREPHQSCTKSLTDLRIYGAPPQAEFPYQGSFLPVAVGQRCRVYFSGRQKHTKALLHKHPFEKDVLIGHVFVAHADILIFRTELLFNQIHGSQAIWPKAYASTRSLLEHCSLKPVNKDVFGSPYDGILLRLFIQRKRHTVLVQSHRKSQSANASAYQACGISNTM